MNTQDRLKVEAILPLTFLQNALLFHSLSASDDQGFIHVKIDISGQVDFEILYKAWLYLVNRHDCFRSSLHWEKIKMPVQVVHPEASFEWKYVDLRSLTPELQKESINKYLAEDKARGFNFRKASISRVEIFQLSDDEHLMIWSCHHLLLDGWSSANVIRELAEVYNANSKSLPVSLPSIPSTQDYSRDIKKNDLNVAKLFWLDYFKGFSNPSFVTKYASAKNNQTSFTSKKFKVEDKAFENLKTYTKSNRLTITSVLQMAWSVVLAGIDNSRDVIFGNIISVRSSRLKNADKMCGLFTNMLPVRVQLKASELPSELSERIQDSQSNTRDHSFVSLDNLQSWIDWPGYMPLFDHIFVVENFPWKDIEKDGVVFKNFRSGITSTYTLTVVAQIYKCLELDFIYEKSKISEDLVDTLGHNIVNILEEIVNKNDITIDQLLKNQIQIKASDKKAITDDSILSRAQNRAIEQPSNSIELKMTGIWENLFKRDGIGINDNFFEIGGKSLLAVRLFQQIQKELNVNVPPISILQYPTISSLSTFISSDQDILKWKSLIPLRVTGKNNPLFCLHAKGGYVFFYNKLASYLDKEQPIYALQPRGLNGQDPLYDSIEEMAAHYIQEIKSIQPVGPYSILATCFSNAVGLEMAKQLLLNGDEIGVLCMVDAIPGKSLQQIISDQGILAKVNYGIKLSKIYNSSKKIYYKLRGRKNYTSLEDDFSLKHEKHLENLFAKYERSQYNEKVTLIRSSEYENLERKDFHIEDWLKVVSQENLEIFVVQGNHKTLFLEPEVRNLAATLNQILHQLQDVPADKQ